jgi:DnaJ-class molecular chaperone
MTEPLNHHCPECLGEGEIYPNDAQDWVRCPRCKGSGKREDGPK